MIGSIWGNLISYFILKPEEVNGTLSSDIGRYNKCGADFSEREYKGAEVVNQIERRTVGIIQFHFRNSFFVIILDKYIMYHLYLYLCLFNLNCNFVS